MGGEESAKVVLSVLKNTNGSSNCKTREENSAINGWKSSKSEIC